MDSQMHRRNYNDHLHHVGDHKDEAQTMNESPVVRSGLAEPTVMGTPVLAEELYATHSDILDTPVRSFAQWEDEERRGAPPPLSTAYETHLTDPPHGGHHNYGGEANKEQFKGSIGKHTFYEEKGDEPPPLSTGYGNPTHDPLHVGGYAYGRDANREQLEGGFGNPIGLEEERYGVPPPSTGSFGTRMSDFSRVGDNGEGDLGRKEPVPFSRVGDHGERDLDWQEPVGTARSTRMEEDTRVPNPTTGGSRASLDNTDTGGNEVGITEVLHSFDKMKNFNEHDTKSLESDKHEPHEPKVYTGSHDQFAPEPVENAPLDTIAANPSNPNSSYTQRISSATSAIADKAAEVKDSIVTKLSSSGENKGDASTTSPRTNMKSSFPTAFSHKVADTLSSTLGPVYEKVAAAGSSVTSKMQGHGHEDAVGSPKSPKVKVKEYLVDTFKPSDDDKVLSEVITHAFNRGKGNQRPQESSTTSYEVEVIRDEGERRLQDSCN